MSEVCARVAVAATAIAVGVLTTLSCFAAPAAAHNELISSTPAADAVLTTAPTEVSLTFSAALNPAATQLAVVDSRARSVVDGSPRIDGVTVRQALTPNLSNGEYRLSYRVVSQDGHTVSDTQSFTVQAAAASPSTAETPAKSRTAHAHQHETSEAASRERADSGGISGWWIVGGGVAVLGVVAGTVLVWRRRTGTQTGQ